MLQMQELMAKSMRDFKEGSIVKGRILEIRPREVLVDIGYKSEGVIPSNEFDDIESLEVGDEVEVLLERLENDEGMVVLSKEKAAYRQNWDKIVAVFARRWADQGQGQSRRQRRTHGQHRRRGFPARVADRHHPAARSPAVRRQHLRFQDRQDQPRPPERRPLPPRTDRAGARREAPEVPREREGRRQRQGHGQEPHRFRRVHRPRRHGRPAPHHRHELGPPRPSERTAQGRPGNRTSSCSTSTRRKSASPSASSRPRRIRGTRSKSVSRSARRSRARSSISCLTARSWNSKKASKVSSTSPNSPGRSASRPSDVLTVGQEVEAVVLGVNKEEQKISLGLRQLEANPWDEIEKKFTIGSRVKGKIRNLTTYGAFVELEEGIDGMIHVSDHVLDAQDQSPVRSLQEGRRSRSGVLEIDKTNQRIASAQTARRRSVEEHRRALQDRRSRHRQGHEARELRRVRAIAGRHRRPRPHLADQRRPRRTRSRTCSKSARKSKRA